MERIIRKAVAILLLFMSFTLLFAQLDSFPVTPGIGELPLWGAPAFVNYDTIAFIAIGSTDDSLYAYGLDGSTIDGFPIAMPGLIRSKIAWEPIDDAVLLVTITTNGYLCLVEWYDGITTTTEIPLGSSANYISPVIADMEGDGELEIFAAVDTTIYCYSLYGNFLWSADFYSSSTDNSAVATPSVGDIDGDGEMEIIIESYEALFAFNSDGSSVDSFPIELPEDVKFSYSSPFLWDYDSDGLCEIFCGVHGISGSEYGAVYVVNGDEPSLDEPLYVITGAYGTWIYSPACAGDVNGDYSYDITFGTVNGTVFGITGDGALASFGGVGLHFSMGHIYGGVLLADVDGNAGPEYIFQMIDDEYNTLVIIDPGADYVEGFPDSMPDIYSGILTPAYLNYGDSTYIAAATSDGNLYLWGFEGNSLPGYVFWTELYGDRHNRSLMPPDPVTLEVDMITEGDSAGYYNLVWDECISNEFAGYHIYTAPDSIGTFADSSESGLALITTITSAEDTEFVYLSSLPAESTWFFIVVEDFYGRTSPRSIPKQFIDTTVILEKTKTPDVVELSISPSPFNSSCRIYAPNAATLEILSLNGKILKVIPTTGDFARLNASDIPSGVLLIIARIPFKQISF